MNREFVSELRALIAYLEDRGFLCQYGRLQQIYERAERRGIVCVTANDKRYIGEVRNLLDQIENCEDEMQDLLQEGESEGESED